MNRALKIARFERYKRELDELETERAALVSQLAAMDARIAAKRADLARDAPIAMLPDDIGVEILRAAYQHDFPHCRCDSGRVVDSPVTISHVNRWWRRLALSLPQIWSCIHLTVEQPDNVKFTEITKLYLERSNNHPISIFCCCFTEDFDAHPQYLEDWDEFLPIWHRYEQAWRALIAQKGRWRNCAIYGLHYQFVRNLLAYMADEEFPQLEYFGASLWEDSGYDLSMKFGFTAPRLRHLRSYYIDWLGSFHRSMPTFFGNLTEVALSEVPVVTQRLWQFLRKIKSTLNTLVLTRVHPQIEGEIPHPRSPLSLPKLRTLIISGVELLAWPILAAAPVLSTLHVSETTTLLPYILEKGITMPTIRRLEIISLEPYGEDPNPTETDEGLVSVFPSVEILWMNDDNVMSAIFKAIKRSDVDTKEIAFPRLRELVVSGEDPEMLASMVSWCTHSGRPLYNYAVFMPSHYHAQPFRQVPFPFDFPFSTWNTWIDRPSIVPWNGEWDVYDQYIAVERGFGSSSAVVGD